MRVRVSRQAGSSLLSTFSFVSPSVIVLLIVLLPAVRGDIVEMGRTTWQLYSHCSRGFLQVYLRHVDANGSDKSRCLTDFHIRVDHRTGILRLQHALTGRYLCFNRRMRITIRLDGRDPKCGFIEHLSESGHTELESAFRRGVFLGFNQRGRFQDPRRFGEKRRCFNFNKFERYVPNEELRQCARQQKEETATTRRVEEHRVFGKILRDSLLEKIRARAEEDVVEIAEDRQVEPSIA